MVRALEILLVAGLLPGCSIVLGPSDLMGGRADAGAPVCLEPDRPDPPRWMGCPVSQQGPSGLGGTLAAGDLTIAGAPGGGMFPALGANAIIETDGTSQWVTLGRFPVGDIDASNALDLRTVLPMTFVWSVALRRIEDNSIAINILGSSASEPNLVGWFGTLGVGGETPGLYGLESSQMPASALLGRSGITGGLLGPDGEPVPVRHVWRERRAGHVELASIGDSGDLASYIASEGAPAPADMSLPLEDCGGEWVVVSTPEQLFFWNARQGGTIQELPSAGRSGRAAIGFAGGCGYAAVFARGPALVVQPLRCAAECRRLETSAPEVTVATEGDALLPAVAAMPGGGWAIADVENDSAGSLGVAVRFFGNAFGPIGSRVVLLTPMEAGAPSRYEDLQTAVVERDGRWTTLVTASYRTADDALHQWIAAVRLCGG